MKRTIDWRVLAWERMMTERSESNLEKMKAIPHLPQPILELFARRAYTRRRRLKRMLAKATEDERLLSAIYQPDDPFDQEYVGGGNGE